MQGDIYIGRMLPICEALLGLRPPEDEEEEEGGGLLLAGDVRRCVVCGCTEAKACPGGCTWVAPNLCSRCAHVAREAFYGG